MNTQQEIETIELSIKHARAIVEEGKAIRRLLNNRDFKKTILDQLFEKEPVRLVLLKAEPTYASAEAQEGLMKEMDVIGGFRKYLTARLTLADQVSGEIEGHEDTLEELRSED